MFLLSSSSSSLLLLLSSSSSFYYYYYYHYYYHYRYHYYYYYYYCHYSVNNIPYQCDITCAGHFTLDALASRTVACWIYLISLPIFVRVAWLALGQHYGCPSASQTTLKDMVKIDRCQTVLKPFRWDFGLLYIEIYRKYIVLFGHVSLYILELGHQ